MADFKDRYIDVFLGNSERQIVRGIYQYDHGLKLRLNGLPTTSLYQMQYGCVGNKETTTVVSTIEDGVIVASIPDAQLMQPKDLVCYIYLEKEGSGLTVYEILMPIIRRIKPVAETYTPEQIDNFNTLMDEFNDLIDAIDGVNTQSQAIKEDFQAEVDRLDATTFYVDPSDGNLYIGS